MQIVIIGAGNMSTQLCYNFHLADLQDVQVFSRSLSKASHLQKEYQVSIIDHWANIHPEADYYLIAVSDDAIELVSSKLKEQLINSDGIVAHTSGSVSMEILDKHSNYASFYPLQSLRKNRLLWFAETPILYAANNNHTKEKIKSLAQMISGRCYEVQDDTRSQLHLPAVLVNNFVNYIYTIAFDYCAKQNLPKELLYALMKETTDRIIDGGDPMTLQTGPAIRHDKKTLKRHKELLGYDTEYQKLYSYISDKIMNDQKLNKE